MSYAVSRRVLAENGRIFPLEVGGEKVFVKKRSRPRNALGIHLQRLLCAATGIVLLRPPEKSPVGDIRHEAATLARLAAGGIRVPDILHVEDDYFVMSDVGPSLEAVIRDNPAEGDGLVRNALDELRRLHDLRFAHGGAQIKNMAVREGVIHFLDFEEVVPERHLEDFQVRDLFLFLFSLERCGFNPDLPGLLAAYGKGGAEARPARLLRFLKKMRIITIADSRLFRWLKIRDIRAISTLVKKAAALEPSTRITT